MKADNISLFTPYIEEMIKFKISLGYERRTYDGFLYDFSRFCSKSYPAQEYLTEELTLAWCVRRPSESQSGFRRRIIPLREFGKYLNAMGVESYVLPSNFAGGRTTFTPYILSDVELSTIFAESDSLNPSRNFSYCHIIVPTLLRMIYFCGLRPNEGREIRREDVDLKEGILFIRKNKSHRERYVPMSEDMRRLCITYNKRLESFIPDSEYFFPNSEGTPYPAKWLTCPDRMGAATLLDWEVYCKEVPYQLEEMPAFPAYHSPTSGISSENDAQSTDDERTRCSGRRWM